MKNILPLIFLVSLSSCFILRRPALNITDKYVVIKNPGQSYYFTEINALTTDSIFQYPSEEKVVLQYEIINRKSNRMFGGSKKIKMKFSKKNSKYKWLIWKDYTDQNKNYVDTITIKPLTWYTLSSSNTYWKLYFYWSGKPGDYILKEKPQPGAW